VCWLAGTAEHLGYGVAAGQNVAGAQGGVLADVEQDVSYYHGSR
jgi:hypothetical protein